MTAQTQAELVGPGEHVVHFYDHTDELAVAVSVFLARGLAQGEAALVVALPEHLEAFENRLAATGIDVAAARASRSYVTMDARDAARAITTERGVDPGRFAAEIGDLVAELGAERPLRVYGEIVAVLWDSGDVAAAIEVEAQWNRLGDELAFSLYCAYPVRALDHRPQGHSAICAQHTHVVRALALPESRPGIVVRRLEATAYAVPVARQMLREVLAGWGWQWETDDALLVLAELVANAVEHARGPFEVTVHRLEHGVRLEVTDPLATLPVTRRQGELAEGGRGLLLVRELAVHWGSEIQENGKTTWAEVLCGRSVSE